METKPNFREKKLVCQKDGTLGGRKMLEDAGRLKLRIED